MKSLSDLLCEERHHRKRREYIGILGEIVTLVLFALLLWWVGHWMGK